MDMQAGWIWVIWGNLSLLSHKVFCSMKEHQCAPDSLKRPSRWSPCPPREGNSRPRVLALPKHITCWWHNGAKNAALSVPNLGLSLCTWPLSPVGQFYVSSKSPVCHNQSQICSSSNPDSSALLLFHATHVDERSMDNDPMDILT